MCYTAVDRQVIDAGLLFVGAYTPSQPNMVADRTPAISDSPCVGLAVSVGIRGNGGSGMGRDLEKKRSRARAYYAAHPEKVKEKSQRSAEQRKESGYYRAYYEAHREEKKAKSRQYRLDHLEEKRAADRGYYQQHREAFLAWCSQYAKEHREKINARFRKWREANRDRLNALMREWAHTPEGRATKARYQNIRRARKAGATIGVVDYDFIKARDKMLCCICGKKVSDADLSFDHVIPLAAGGEHSTINIRVSHLRCNVRRNNGYLPSQTIMF